MRSRAAENLGSGGVGDGAFVNGEHRQLAARGVIYRVQQHIRGGHLQRDILNREVIGFLQRVDA